MSAINTAGAPQTSDYTLGRGAAYFAPLVNSLPGAYRHLGNCPEFNVSVEVETLEHQSSLQGLRVTDKSVIISQELSISFQLDELNGENVALFYSGDAVVFANAVAVAGFGDYEMISSVELGRWYDIVDSNGVRVYNILASTLTVTAGTAGVLDDEAASPDFTVDTFGGRLFFPNPGGTAGLVAAETINVTLAANAAAGTVDEIRALINTNVLGALKFVGQNPVSNDKATEYQFHQVSLKPEGDLALIGDEFAQAGFSAIAESNATADADSPTLTVRTLTP